MTSKRGKTSGDYQTPDEVEISGGPAFADKNVLLGGQDNFLYALNLKTGKPDWTYKIKDQIRCTPAIANGVIFLAGCDSQLHLFGASTKSPPAPSEVISSNDADDKTNIPNRKD